MTQIPQRDHFHKILDEMDKRYNQRFEGQEKAVNAALAAAEKAVAVAEANSEKWRANANEWRKAMDDRERNFVSKSTGIIALIFNSIIAVAMYFK